jgi:hypothetical protein
LSRINAQLSDIVRTLKSAKQTEGTLRQRGILTSFGSLGTLMEVLPSLEKVTSNSIILQAAQGSADKRLASVLFEEFLVTLLEAIESELAKSQGFSEQGTSIAPRPR